MNAPTHLEAVLDTLPTKPGCYIMKERRRQGHLRRQGDQPAQPGALLFPQQRSEHDLKTRQLVRTHRRYRMDRGRFGARGADPRDEPDQEAPPALQHPPEGRQALPLHQGALGRSLPQGDRHPPDGQGRLALFRPLHQRVGGAPDAGRAAAHLPLPDLRPGDHRPGRARPACITTSSCAAAPCIGAINQAGYRQMIDDLCKFLEGHTEPIVTRLQAEMEQAAEELQFEKAAAIRDQIHAIEQVVEKQKVISPATRWIRM